MSAQFNAENSHHAAEVDPRLKMLVAAHLVIGILPVFAAAVPMEVEFLPLFWALTGSLPLSQLMLLAFWAGMGRGRATFRFVGALTAIGYIAVWPTLSFVLRSDSIQPSWLGTYLGLLGMYCSMAFVFTGIFLIMRRRWFKLRSSSELGALQPGPFQYSIMHLLVIASLTSVVLVLMQRARGAAEQPPTEWQMLAIWALVLLVYPTNVVSAVRAALVAGAAAWPIFLSLLTAALLGVAVAVAARHDGLTWSVFVGSVLVLTLPTAIVIASLLVARSCGYRLITRPVRHS